MYLERARARLQSAAETESDAKAQLTKATSARIALEKDVEQAEVLLETFKSQQAEAEQAEAQAAAQKRTITFGGDGDTEMTQSPFSPATCQPSSTAQPPGQFSPGAAATSPFAPSPYSQIVNMPAHGPSVVHQLQHGQATLTGQLASLTTQFAALLSSLSA
eukprot:1489898-Pyramimonas_sp.AAC.1